MKNIKRLLFTLFIVMALPIVGVYAQDGLSIGDKSYDENTQVFTVSGTSNYSDVMVSLFDGEELLSFKTVQPSGGKYNATFKIYFDEDKTITIKVGDINSTEYKISTLDVKKSVTPQKSNKLVDDGGNSLTILDKSKKFELEDRLEIEIITDFSNMDEEDKQVLELIKKKLGGKKNLVGIMNVAVLNGDNNVDLEEIKNGYELFLKVDEKDLSSFNKPYAARLLLGEDIEIEEGKALTYNSKIGGAAFKINNIGIYVLYDDVTVNYKFLDNTANQKYYLYKGNTITFKVDADFEKFLNVYIDNKLVDSKNYTKKSGSTIVTLNKSYLQTLSVGEHSVKIDFTDGEAKTTLTVINKNPRTYDDIMQYIVIGIVGFVGLALTSTYAFKSRKHS